MSEQPRKIPRKLTLVAGIICLVLSIPYFSYFINAILFVRPRVGVGPWLLLILFFGLMFLGTGLDLLMGYYKIGLRKNKEVNY